MSFPNIPDINPYINITFEDAINLLLTSIAMEEVSLSKLMDAETSKILCVLDNCKHHDCKHGDCKHGDCRHDDCRHDDCGHDDCRHEDCGHDDCGHNDCMLHDALEINKSVDNTLKNMIKLQMLLQFKLDNIKEILPCTNSTTTTSTSTSTTTTCTRTTTTKTTSSTTTTSHTTTCTTSTCSTTTKKECSCSLTGNGKGCVPNCCDEFYNHMAVLYTFVYCRDDVKNRTIRYSVGNDDVSLRMHASGYNVKMQCPDQCNDQLVIYGKGSAEKHEQCHPDITGYVEFTLAICKKAPENLEFRMEIKPEKNPELNHDSGFVQVRSTISNLRLVISC